MGILARAAQAVIHDFYDVFEIRYFISFFLHGWCVVGLSFKLAWNNLEQGFIFDKGVFL